MGKSIGEQIEDRRHGLGLSRRDLSHQTGFSEQTIYAWERKGQEGSYDNIQEVLDVLTKLENEK